MRPLISTILDLDHALGGNVGLIIGGGLGLFLKQQHLQAQGARTLLEARQLPAARVTKDIDLFLRAEIVAHPTDFARIRTVMDALNFRPIEAGKYFQFVRQLDGVDVLIDLMVGPLAGLDAKVRIKGERASPKSQTPKIELHARSTPDALAIEANATPIPVSGTRTADGQQHTCEVMIPCSFTYALMKLGALGDRIDDVNKNEGRHHAMDLYRIVGLQTEQEVVLGKQLASQFRSDPQLSAALERIDVLFTSHTTLGSLRLREYQRDNPGVPPVDLDWFVPELRRLLSGN